MTAPEPITLAQRVLVANCLTSLKLPRLSLQTMQPSSFHQLVQSNEEEIAQTVVAVENMFAVAGHCFEDHGCQRSVCVIDGAMVKIPYLSDAYALLVENPEAFAAQYGTVERIAGFSLRDNLIANVTEAYAYQTTALSLPIAPCRLLWHASGVPVLVMEHLQRLATRQEVIDMQTEESNLYQSGWMGSFDGPQVGWSQLLGSWAGYDAALPPYWFRSQGHGPRQWLEHLTQMRTTMSEQDAVNQQHFALTST